MRLHHQDFGGQGVPLVILHGLFGSSNNWQRIGSSLNPVVHVLALDLRNHGRSPHADSHSLRDMVWDLEDWVHAKAFERPILMGHSMGGLAAMAYAVTHPEDVRALIVVDIAPKAYTHSREREFRACRTDISRLKNREELDEALRDVIPEPEIRRFLLMNAVRTQNGYRWRINVPALEKSRFLTQFPDFPGTYGGDALFVVGGESGHVGEKDHDLIRSRFPKARIEIISGAGHWLHYSAEEEFLERVRLFLSEILS